ncbi:hypothetical protein VAPA_1c26270 [Variovorax paradoxus B4]|uniref:Uncharacterized protein n=1 Tax=Variovorax paradoxus B4 TaxID=1246301 RepID=T1XC41_VARPD|nr:hypothetical protein VAPA_1c26270 [Variovorax paradoxus B4]
MFRARAQATEYSPPRMSPAFGSSLIPLRGAPDALRTMSAVVVLADQRPLHMTLPSMGCLARRNQGGGRRPEDIRFAAYPVGGSAP